MATSSSSQPSEAQSAAGLRTISLSRIVIEDGFNPRAQIDKDEQARLVHSIAQHGVLQPVLVCPREDGDYTLIAGQRRLLAAAEAGVLEIPAHVRNCTEDGESLVQAFVENSLRADLNPLEQARACARLLQAGLTRKGVAEKLSMTQARVKERLALLQLPDELHPQIAAGEIPLAAVKALVELVKIHPGLPGIAVTQVLDPPDGYEPYTWGELAENPLRVCLAYDRDLPAGVFHTGHSYGVQAFSLSEQATRDLAAYLKLAGRPISAVRFDHSLVEQARALGAVHDADRYTAVIVGQDVADQLAGDYINDTLKSERAFQRRRRQLEKQRTANATDQEQPAAEVETGAAEVRETAAEQEERERREAQAKREADRQVREQAVAHNLDLGREVVRCLSKVKVSERELKLLTAIDIGGDLGDLAMRGARYGFPGWVQEVSQRNGKTKMVYLECTQEAEAKAREYLAGATTAGEIAGRCLALVVMAIFADQAAVAQSNRSWHTVHADPLPWQTEVGALIDDLAREKLPQAIVEQLEPRLSERARQRADHAAYVRERESARERVHNAEGHIAELTDEELEALTADATLAYGPYDQATTRIRSLVRQARAQANAEADRTSQDGEEREKVVAES